MRVDTRFRREKQAGSPGQIAVRTAEFDYELPAELIARWPLPQRQASRMMVVDRAADRIEHRRFEEIFSFIREGDLLVFNDTKVIPARAFSNDGRIELLFLEQTGERAWKCMVKPGRRMRIGHRVELGEASGEVTGILPEGERLIAFDREIDLEKIGRLALPPYMERQSEVEDTERYQTVYARTPGAIAAPTAGLHFTKGMLERLPHVFVTLHVGAGTFRPVQVDTITEHRMHSERFIISPETAEAIRSARRVIAVGTTTVRVLETCMAREGAIVPIEGSTDIFIYPGFQFRAVHALLTNFHLPKSTLLMLVSAFAGTERIRQAYAAAIAERYRFYSYGDCMLIV